MVSPSSFYIIIFSLMALHTALLVATGIRYNVVNELELRKKEIKKEKFHHPIFGKINVPPELRERFCSRIDEAKDECISNVAREARHFKQGCIPLFVAQLILTLVYESQPNLNVVFYGLLSLVVISIFFLVWGAVLFTKLVSLPRVLDKEFEEGIWEAAVEIGFEKLAKSKI